MTHASTFSMLDDYYQPISVRQSEIRRYVKAPSHPEGMFADRYELHDGRVVWGQGSRGWYDEHALQGGLRTIDYRRKDEK